MAQWQHIVVVVPELVTVTASKVEDSKRVRYLVRLPVLTKLLTLVSFKIAGIIVQYGDVIDINTVWGVTVTCKTDRWHEDMTLDTSIVHMKDLSRNEGWSKSVKLPRKMVVVVDDGFSSSSVAERC